MTPADEIANHVRDHHATAVQAQGVANKAVDELRHTLVAYAGTVVTEAKAKRVAKWGAAKVLEAGAAIADLPNAEAHGYLKGRLG